MTRIKRRYVIVCATGSSDAAAISKELMRLLAEVYGDLGVGTVADSLAVKWSCAPHGWLPGNTLVILRLNATGYRRIRVCLALLTQVDKIPTRAAAVASTGSLNAALKLTERMLKRPVARSKLHSGSAQESDVAAVQADIAALKKVTGV
eukprot:Rhum_TRINITY_DN12082_c0_g1::Rhum_TRINITY_DN12082_c0_g1_i2::g.49063::m.49063/K03537/POP5; ribonuclease P/MRP protein subunit POP5